MNLNEWKVYCPKWVSILHKRKRVDLVLVVDWEMEDDNVAQPSQLMPQMNYSSKISAIHSHTSLKLKSIMNLVGMRWIWKYFYYECTSKGSLWQSLWLNLSFCMFYTMLVSVPNYVIVLGITFFGETWQRES